MVLAYPDADARLSNGGNGENRVRTEKIDRIRLRNACCEGEVQAVNAGNSADSMNLVLYLPRRGRVRVGVEGTVRSRLNDRRIGSVGCAGKGDWGRHHATSMGDVRMRRYRIIPLTSSRPSHLATSVSLLPQAS